MQKTIHSMASQIYLCCFYLHEIYFLPPRVVVVVVPGHLLNLLDLPFFFFGGVFLEAKHLFSGRQTSWVVKWLGSIEPQLHPVEGCSQCFFICILLDFLSRGVVRNLE